MHLPGGFVFYPSRYSPPIGHEGVAIDLVESRLLSAGCIRCATFLAATSRPGERTFHDIRGEDGESETVHVCPGLFRLRAASDNVLYGYSFGGNLCIHAEGDYSRCDFSSPAPVFDLADGVESTNVFLYSEFVALLARRRAAWNDDTRFGRCLITADPFELFIATIVLLAEHLGSFRSSAWTEEYRRGAVVLRRWMATLREAGQWPLVPLRLEALM